MRNSALSFALICLLPGAPEGGSKMELPPVEVRHVVEGVYEVRRAGGDVGRESFVRTFLTNNTVIYESVFEVIEGESLTVSGNNRLEVEADSGFPRSYYTRREAREPGGGNVREVIVEMYSNVAVVSERRNDDERRRVLALPTGCLFIEGSIAHHLSAVLERLDRDAGGRQVFRAFDPLGLATTDVAIELVGDSTSVADRPTGGARPAADQTVHYRYFAGKSPAVDFFVDAEDEIVRIHATADETEYFLVSMDKRSPTGGETAE